MRRSRFIAGAICPKCGAVDRIVVEGDFDERERCCVACNFRESIPAREDGQALDVSIRDDAASSAVADVIRVVGDADAV